MTRGSCQFGRLGHIPVARLSLGFRFDVVMKPDTPCELDQFVVCATVAKEPFRQSAFSPDPHDPGIVGARYRCFLAHRFPPVCNRTIADVAGGVGRGQPAGHEVSHFRSEPSSSPEPQPEPSPEPSPEPQPEPSPEPSPGPSPEPEP